MAVNYQKVYDNLDVDERIEFRDLTIKAILEIYPHYVVRPFQPGNPDLIFIGNQQENVRVRFPLYDLYAHFALTGKTKADLKDKILLLYADMLKTVEDSELVPDYSTVTWADVSKAVIPRLMRREELAEIDSYAFLPFDNDLVTAFVTAVPQEANLQLWITKEMIERWNVNEQQLWERAMDNFGDLTDGLEVVKTVSPHSYMRTDSNQEFAATAVLLAGFRYLISQYLGSPYRFGMPSRYILYAWSEFDDEDFQKEMKAMMTREFNRLPSKLTTNIYEVDDKGQIKLLKNQPEITPPDVSNN